MATSASDPVYSNWVKQIKNDKLESIYLEFKENLRDEHQAFKCFIHINQLVYKAVQENKICKSNAEVIYQMSDVCCSVFSSSWCCDTEIFLRCLFHIINYFIVQGCLIEAKMLCTYIFSLVKVKPTLEKKSEKCPLHDIVSVFAQDIRRWNDDMFTFEKKGRVTLQDWCNFILCLIKLCPSCVYISKYVSLLITVSQRYSLINAGNKRELLYFQLESLKAIASCENGFLDTDNAFPILFYLLHITLRNIIHLDLINEEGPILQCYIDDLQQMFYKEEHKESFILCSNIIKIFVMQADSFLLITKCNSLLLKWLYGCAYPTCISILSFIKLLFINLRSFKTLTVSNPSQYRLDSQLKLILNFVKLLEKNESLKSGDKKLFTEDYVSSVVQCLYSVLFITYKNGNLHHETLKECFDNALLAHSECLQWLIKMGKIKYKNTEYITTLFLTGSVNTCRAYINAGRFEESLCFAIPACKYLLMLPKNVQCYSDIERFEDCILKCIGISYQKTGQTENALLACIAWISCYPNSMIKVFSIWEEVKEREVSENQSANVDTTVYDIITVKSEELAEKWGICNFTKSQQEEMLLKELSVYYNNRLLRGRPMFGVFSALQIITSDPLTLAKGLIMTMDIASADENYLIQSAELLDYSKIVVKHLIKKKDKLLDLAISQCELYCLLGNLIYQQFRCELQSARNISETEMVKLTIEPRKPLMNIEPGAEVNPHDACDIMPAYSSLSLKKMTELLVHLFNAYDYWMQAHKKMKKKPDFDLSSTFENMKEAGIQLKLYCARTKEEQLWNLLYNMAYVADRSDLCVLAVAELLDVQEGIAQSKIEYATSIVSKPGIDENIKFTFLIQCAAKYLSDNKVSDGLNLIATLRKDMKTDFHVYLHAKFLMIVSLYCRTPGIDDVLLNDSVSPSVTLYKALCVLLSVIQNKGWRNFYELCQIHLLLLRVSHEMGQFYCEQHQVREARCFIKPELSVAQKLLLPLRTAQLLILLAWVDLSCVNMCDCNIKLDGLEKILDIHSTGSTVTSSLGSPTFVNTQFSGPKFINHLAECTCFSCTNLNYQHLVLEAITLRAHFFTVNGDMDTAMEYFRVGCAIQQKLCREAELLPQFIVVSVERFFLYYTDFLCASNKYKDARILNLKTQDLLKSVTFGGILINICIIEQNLCIQQLNTKKVTMRQFTVEQTPVKQVMPDSCLKTPCNYPEKITIIKTPLRKYNGPNTPFVHPPPIPFRLDMNVDESEKENTPSPAIKVQHRTRPPPKLTRDQHKKLKSRAVRKL